MPYIAQNDLQRQQNRLQLNLIQYSLGEEWRSSELISNLRDRLYPKMPHGFFDPQDLEHQVLFRLTTFDPDEITDDLIESIVEEQRVIIEDRLSDVEDREYLYRGLDRRSKDLNVEERLELKNDNGRLYATGYGRTFDVEFRKITDESIIKLFTEKLHYIHNGRHKGDAFGFYFVGDDMPWGVETTEPSLGVKRYKREALIAHGIDPNKAVEITRLYLLPGSPKNAISILDGLVSRYYKEKGIEAMYTTTMPMYAKTRGATTAGGMRNVLLVKEQSHGFRKSVVNGKVVYVHDVGAAKSTVDLATHPKFPTLLTVETFMRLNKNYGLRPLEVLKEKTIYINPSQREGERHSELRFSIESLAQLLESLRINNVHYVDTLHVADTFWGCESLSKLRFRCTTQRGKTTYETSHKYRISKETHIRTLVNDTLYKGDSRENAVSVIKVADMRYKPENSYEKMRMLYRKGDVSLCVDVYPFGVFLKIVGDESQVVSFSSSLGFDKTSDIDRHADDIYLEWTKAQGLPELWHVKFGLQEGVSNND